MVGDGHVVLTAFAGCEPNMAARLSCGGIAETRQSLRKLSSRDVPGKPHGAMTSSLTKWSRMTAGPSPSSKWHRTASRICSRISSIVSASVKMDTPKALAVYPPSSASSITNTSSLDAAFRNSLSIGHSSDLAWPPTTRTMHDDPTAGGIRKYGVGGFALATDDHYLYFTWQEDIGDIWVMDVVE